MLDPQLGALLRRLQQVHFGGTQLPQVILCSAQSNRQTFVVAQATIELAHQEAS
jgi:hypothetical protein